MRRQHELKMRTLTGRSAPAFLLLATTAVVGCESPRESPDERERAAWLDTATLIEAPSYDELRTQSRAQLDNREVFIVEGDLVLETEDALADYYDETYLEPREKSIVNKANGARGVRSNPTNLTFCVAGTNWAVQNYWTYADADKDGVRDPGESQEEDETQRSTQALATTLTNLAWRMKAWQGVANIRFVYASHLDGANCATPAVSFTITRNFLTCTDANPCSVATSGWDNATEAYPSSTVQAITIPMNGASRTLAISRSRPRIGFTSRAYP